MWDNWRNKLDIWKNLHEGIDDLQKMGGLRIWILHVLEDGPKNGVEIMDAIQEHHEKMYQMRRGVDNKHYRHHLQKTMGCTSRRPSPGSVYPMLKKMVNEDLIRKMEDGKYELTDKGREIVYKIFGRFHEHVKNMDRGALAIENVLTEIDSYISYLEDIKKEKLASHEEEIRVLGERLKKLRESLQEE